ncbi:MAG: hypothetical protein KF802_02520 [Bdellovibrionaceae bacterium]|nr:hypothetical protein [Pseudobdellovibrionaceae bacterium]
MKTKAEILKEVREQVTKEWSKTGPIDDFIGIFMDQEIVNRTEREYLKQLESASEKQENSRKTTHYDK